MAEVGLKELLEAGVHFGHQTRRWNPKMRRFIHGENGGIYLIDLLKTQVLLSQAQQFATEIAHRGGTVLFVGTKKQARDGIKEIATASNMPYVNHRWLGGLLTNYQTMAARIKRLHDLERYQADGQLSLLPTRERLSAEADLLKLQANLGGVKNMTRVPDAMTIEEADHVQATRLYHNTAQVHFDAKTAADSRFGKRIVYGGHVISVAMSLAQNGLQTQLKIAAWNGGSHVAPTFAGDTLRAFTQVVERAEVPKRRDVGALRLRLNAVKNVSAAELAAVPPLMSGTKDSRIVLELDYWSLFPR